MEYKEAERAVIDIFGVVADQRTHSGESSGEDSGELMSAMSSGVLIEAVSVPLTEDRVTLVDARGDTIMRSARRPESAWGVEVVRVAEKRLTEARRFREWVLQ
jgi:hypothetical protein